MKEKKFSVEIKGRNFGPFGTRRLQEFVDRGQIEAATLLTGRRGDRVPASAIPGLRFPERHGQLDAADPELVKRFTSSAPKPYPQPIATTPLPTAEPSSSQTAVPPDVHRDVAHHAAHNPVARDAVPKPEDHNIEVEPAVLEIPDQSSSAVEDPPPASSSEDDDKTVMKEANYENSEAQFAAAEVARTINWNGQRGAGNPAQASPAARDEDVGTKVCPFCDEIIKSAAQKCRYCKEWLPKVKEGQEPVSNASTEQTPEPTPQTSGIVVPPAMPTSPTNPSVTAAAPVPARTTPALDPAVGGSPQYACPCCRAVLPNINYIPEQKRINCTVCGFWTEATFESPPPAETLATARCIYCQNSTRYIASEQVYFCDVCRAYAGEAPEQPTEPDNTLGWKFWAAFVFALGVGFFVIVYPRLADSGGQILFVVLAVPVLLVVVVISAIWVFADALAIGVRKGLQPGFLDMGPVGWALACLFFWVMAFPLYLANRADLKKAAAKESQFGLGNSHGGPSPVNSGPLPRPCPSCGSNAPLMKVDTSSRYLRCSSCGQQ